MNNDQACLLKEKYDGEKSEGFFTDCQRLETGEPLAFVIGWAPFLDCRIYLDAHPLIPRPETEFWAEQALLEIKRVAPQAPRILDLCAGSGCVGVAVAKTLPEASVDFCEIDARLLPTIQKNLDHNPTNQSTRSNLVLAEKYQVFTSDLFASMRLDLVLGDEQLQYDFILSNPPYIDPALDRTQPSVKNFEPHQALYGGAGGMEIIEKIITQAPAYLYQSGQLWLEHEPEQSLAIQAIGHQAGFTATTHLDQYKVERYSILVLQ